MPAMTVAFAPPMIAVNPREAVGDTRARVAHIRGSRLNAPSESREDSRRREILNRPNHMTSLNV
jgi:hypothetical protein